MHASRFTMTDVLAPPRGVSISTDDVPLYSVRVAYAINITIGTPAQPFRVILVRIETQSSCMCCQL
jgi:hypothetical protein